MAQSALPIDLYGWFDTLTPDENARRLAMRAVLERDIAPVADAHWDRGEFYHDALKGFHAFDPLAHYFTGGAANRALIDGLYSLELARVDPSMASYFGVHGGLCAGSIMLLGSDAQKAEWLPALRAFEKIGCFGLTEPEAGSGVARGLTTSCRRDGDTWVLNGEKKWIGNSTFADVVVIWARDEADSSVKGFLVRTELPGYSARLMTGKISQRTLASGWVTMTDLRVAEGDRLAHANSFADTARVLSAARIGVAFQAVGCAMGAYEHALRYAGQRQQFGRPIAGFQLVQMMLVRMLGNITAMLGMAMRAARLQDAGQTTDAHTSLAKQFCAFHCRETVQLARELMGGNGVLLEHGAARLFADAEAIYSYEGTNEMTALVVGRAITGESAFV
jgi:glutaryl-CoA dehydrogenase